MEVWLRLGVSAWLAGLAVVDLRTRRIPNALVLPVLLSGLVWRLAQAHWEVAVACVGLYLLWLTGLLGGAGDAKLLMALTTLFPRADYALVLAAMVLAIAWPWTVIRYRGRWRDFFRALRPTEERLDREGVPFAWVYAVGTVIYIWTSLS